MRYEIDKRKNLLVEKLNGIVTKEKFYKLKREQFNDKDYNESLSILSDIRDCFLEISVKEISRFALSFRIKIKKDSVCRIAIITDTPQQTAYAAMFQELMKGSCILIKVFNTYEAAYSYLFRK